MKIILLTLLSFTVWAENFEIAGNVYDFSYREGLLVKGCDRRCEALQTVRQHRRIDMHKIRPEGFSNSIGSDVCKYVYKAESVLGVSENRDGRAFCVFSDNSLIEINSLTQYLIEVQIVTE